MPKPSTLRRAALTGTAASVVLGCVAAATTASAAPRHDASGPAASSVPSASSTSSAWSPNLVVNGDAEFGDASASGYDQVTIPGWNVAGGSATVVPYGAKGFFDDTYTVPTNHGKNFFAGGDVGSDSMSQTVDLSGAAAGIDAGGVRYDLNAWLGGWVDRWDTATVTATFEGASGTSLGTSTISPGGGMWWHSRFYQEDAAGTLPSGTRKALITVDFAKHSVSNANLPGITQTYDNGFADNLAFTVTAPLAAPPAPVPPVSTVPKLDHVFVTYLENAAVSDVVGDTSDWPYLNSLASTAASGTNLYAEGKPSDPNYIALAAGQLMGITGNPCYSSSTGCGHPDANIGDRVEAAGKTWKAYLDDRDNPCDYTSYAADGWFLSKTTITPDSLPFVYFDDMTQNRAHCVAHQQQLDPNFAADLQSAATTPDFVWFEGDDCHIGEQLNCGFSSADAWMKTQLPLITGSPAWTTQRSVVIVAFDEDGFGHMHGDDGNRTAYFVLGSPSSGVKSGGFVSSTRYSHYSILRTLEEAEGIAPLTKNDAFAQPMNDFFTTQ
jgi:hypothetical protein